MSERGEKERESVGGEKKKNKFMVGKTLKADRIAAVVPLLVNVNVKVLGTLHCNGSPKLCN